MSYLYNTIIYRPLLNALVILYNTIAFRDLGLSIIFLTIIVRLILYPVFHKSVRQQTIIQKIQPEIDRINKVHKDDKEKQVEATMALWKEHNINPLSGFLAIFIQLPILIALYQIFWKSLSAETIAGLYPFVTLPGALNKTFFGLINLSSPNMIIVALAAAAQYVQGRAALALNPKKPHEMTSMERMSRSMMVFTPLLTFFIFLRMPSAVGLYWLVTSLFSVGQQIIINKQLANGGLGTIHQKDN